MKNIGEYKTDISHKQDDVIDGAPTVRALSKLTMLVESGYGLS